MRRSAPGRFWIAASAFAAAAAHAQVVLDNAWMRPAYAGQPEAAVYVDIRSGQPLRLVAASSPAAERAELVLVEPPGADASKHRVVAEIPVAGGAETRLAYLGSHVRLLSVRRDVLPGEHVPLELAFVDASGTRRTATVAVLVRGLVARKPEAEAAPR